MPKKGSRIVNGTYIDPEDVYADALVASKLALGGPIKYKLKESIAAGITDSWLGEHVVPNIGKQFKHDNGLVRNLGLALLWAVFDETAVEELVVPSHIVDRVKAAYHELPLDDKPPQPVLKVPLHVYRVEDATLIEEIQAVPSSNNNTGDNLARIPAGGEATQHVLQTLVIQQAEILRRLQELQTQANNMDQANRSFLSQRFRQVNGNIRRFGGSIEGAFA